MLSFAEKLAVLESFPELQRKDVSLGRVNFQYENSIYDKKNVVYHLHPNGNGFVYAGHLSGYPTDEKGFVNIRDYSAEELRSIVELSIRSLSPKENDTSPANNEEPAQEERWIGPDDQILVVRFEDDLWYVFAGTNLESAFETYDEAVEYLQEEGFSKQ